MNEKDTFDNNVAGGDSAPLTCSTAVEDNAKRIECEQHIFMNDFDPCMFCGMTIEEYDKELEDLP